MVYCDHCWKNVSGLRVDDGPLCCSECGKVLEDYHFSQEPTFVKNAAGQSKLSGHYIRTIQSEFSASRQRTLDKAYEDIKYLSFNLGVNDETMANQALAFYRIALERNFTKGRKSELVQAACLYIAFRANKKPYHLIEFSNYLRTNVYMLGKVFSQLCEVLRLEEHPIIQKPVDPTRFVYRDVNNLLKQRNVPVCETAESIVDSMKRNWMQTGRKPSGICGAALYVSAQAHGFKCSKSDVLRIAHVCEATLNERLVEFMNTESSNLTIGELNKMAKEHEKNPKKIPNVELNKYFSNDLRCEHRDSTVPYFALGLCEACYKDFDKLSGGLGGGSDPPAFQHAERERMAKSQSESELVKVSNGECERRIEEDASGPESIGANVHIATHDESESFSDVDDQEVDGYLYDEEGKNRKKINWENMYQDYYLEKQEAAKNAAMEKPRKRRAQEAKNSGPAQSAEEATSQMLRAKRLGHKVNFDRVKELYDEPVAPENSRKVRFELPSYNFESKLEDKIKANELGSMDEVEDGDMDGEYHENADEAYDYEYDDYSYDDYL